MLRSSQDNRRRDTIIVDFLDELVKLLTFPFVLNVFIGLTEVDVQQLSKDHTHRSFRRPRHTRVQFQRNYWLLDGVCKTHLSPATDNTELTSLTRSPPIGETKRNATPLNLTFKQTLGLSQIWICWLIYQFNDPSRTCILGYVRKLNCGLTVRSFKSSANADNGLRR